MGVEYKTGLSLIQQVAPTFNGVNHQPARIMGRHMDLGEACIRWILFIMNIFVTLAGVGFIALGLFIKLQATDYEEFLGADFSVSWMFVGAGAVIVLVSGCGCCGANKSSTLFLTTYFLFLLAALFTQVIVLLIIISNKDRIKSDIHKAFVDKIAIYGDPNATGNSTDPFNFIQENFDCCGIENGTKDWSKSAGLALVWIANRTYDVPDSCCVSVSENCGVNGTNVTDSNIIHQKGCETKLYDTISGNLPVVWGTGGALIGLQLFGACGACILRRAIHQHYSY